ncbi:hypothetical protein Tco_1369953 [Tanacetum coccineum]
MDPEKILRKRDHDGDDKDEDPSGRPNQGKKTKSRRTKESKLYKKTSTTKETSKGNALTKGSRSDKFMHAEELVVEPIEEVIMDTLNDDVVNDVDQPQNDPAPKHNWFNNLQGHLLQIQNRSREKQLMIVKSTPDKLTKAHLVGPVYNLLKGTCQSSIELEYNKEECYKALSDQLDWNNPEGYRCPFDFSKSLLLKAWCRKLPKDAQYHQALKRHKQKRVMRADELYKFLDETLKLVLDELHHRILNFRLDTTKRCLGENGQLQTRGG